jgi:Flp pilus assembly protein TadD
MHAQLLEEMPLNSAQQFQQAVQFQARHQNLAAARGYVRALELQPIFFEAVFNLAVLLQEMGQGEEAIACYQQALHLKPDYAPAWGNLGAALRDAGRNRDAINCYRQALRCRPGAPDVLNNLGNALRAQDEPIAAIACFRAALRRSPANAGIQANLGSVLREVGRLDEAVETLERAIQLQPDYAEAHWDLAFARLLQGDFTSGFAEYEWRWRRTDFPPRHFTAPLWRGENLAGRTLLVHAEQGAGDAIQFVRFASLVAELGARVVLECPRALVALFESVEGVQRVIARGDPLPEFDWHVPLMSLAHRLGSILNSLAARVPYLRPPPDRRVPLPPTRGNHPAALRIGLVWRRHPQHRNDGRRSIPLTALEPLFTATDVAFYSLQVAPTADFSGEAGHQNSLINLENLIHDFSDTAALIEQLDLVIAVDTSVAHLAGALACPVWVLLPFAPDWRWLLDRDDSPWYPTMRLFRQPMPGDWTSVVQSVRAALAADGGAFTPISRWRN